MISIEFEPGREYDTRVKYDITFTPKGLVFAINEKENVFRVFPTSISFLRFNKKKESEGWKRLGTAKFATWQYPNTFYHEKFYSNSPNAATNTIINIRFSEKGYNMVKVQAGKGNMATWIRNLIAKELKVSPKELF